MQHGKDIYYDLENSPLQIKTDSVVGSNEEVDVKFYGNSGITGGVALYFSSPPQYKLLKCSTSKTNFSAELPDEVDKVWTISLTKVSDKIRVTLHCNNKEILNFVMSSTTCSYNKWSQYWSNDMEKIWFSSALVPDDTASDYYRPG